MERWASNNFDYLGAADTNGDGTGDANTGNPAAAVWAPRSVIAGRYTVTINAATATTFTLRANPIAQMAGDGFMTINEAGQQAWDEDNNGSIGTGENKWQE
jgi:type IV pilus assembly protein PilE